MQTFMDASPEQLAEVVQTNLLGTLLCTRAAMQALAAQPKGGHIFNIDGAGANALPSPMYAAYGATKAGSLRLRRTPSVLSQVRCGPCSHSAVLGAGSSVLALLMYMVFWAHQSRWAPYLKA